MGWPDWQSRWRRSSIGINPPLLLILLYASIAVLGGIALKFPFASNELISWSDAIFTAVSAITVTGLVVVDTGSVYTGFGQGVIAVLMQLGGLGLMTFAVLILSALGQPIGLSHRMVLRDDLNRTAVNDLLRLVRTIFLVVIICETVGAVVLAFVFVPEFGWSHGIWTSIFHSISAFNNAGFSLYPDSLTQWRTNPLINIVIPLMFIVGGLGYGVVADLATGSGWRRCSLHSKLMLAGTAVLIPVSVIGFAALEWNNPGTLGGLDSTSDRLWVAWFQGVTTRTAGFNTTDIGAIHDTTALMFIILMIIGGGSTSTAGGIKVTTAIVLLLATIAFFRRRQSLVAFGRSIGLEQVFKVMALTTTAILFLVVGTFILLLGHDGEFLDAAFEVASAFGTVGLSRGTTAELDGVGRVVIMVIMFFGRVGPLTLGFFLATRVGARVRYPEGQVYLG